MAFSVDDSSDRDWLIKPWLFPDSFIFTETLSQLNLSDTYRFLYQVAIFALYKNRGSI